MADNLPVRDAQGVVRYKRTTDLGSDVHIERHVPSIADGTALAMGAGAVGTTVQRVTHASDDPVTTALQLIDDAIKTDDAAFTPGTDKVLMVGFQYDDTSPDSVNEGDAGAPRMSANRNQYFQLRDGAANAEVGALVDSSSRLAVQISASALTIAKAHDDAASAGHVAVPALAVRKATPVNMSTTDGDYDFLQVSVGRLWTWAERQPATTATLTSVNDTASSTSILASTAGRRGVILHNDSTSILYLKYGATASTTSYTYKIGPDVTWEMPEPIYTGAIDGIWSADASGAARITELT